MADLNQIRGDTQIQPGTVPASAMDARFAASGVTGDLFVDREDHSAETGTGATGFTLAAAPVVGSEHIFLRGTLRKDGYTMAGLQVVFDVAPDLGDDLVVSYRKLI